MKRKEFIEKMNEAESYLLEESVTRRHGICKIIDKTVSCKAYRKWDDIFDYIALNRKGNRGTPVFDYDGINDQGVYYYGYRTKENLPLRHLALSLFREICLTEKYYKEF